MDNLKKNSLAVVVVVVVARAAAVETAAAAAATSLKEKSSEKKDRKNKHNARQWKIKINFEWKEESQKGYRLKKRSIYK